MKKLSILALAAAGLLFGACSSDKDVAEDERTSVLNGNGDGYVGITISIPSAQTTTRANDELNNGKDDEFTVHNAYLYLFKGTSEANATFLRRYSIEQSFSPDEQGQQEPLTPTSQTGVSNGTKITSTAVAVCKIDKPNLGSDNLFAFVAVNAQGDLSGEPAVGTPFSKFSIQQLPAADNGGTLEGMINTNGLLMTNSPISNKSAGSAAPVTPVTLSTLVSLNKDKIKNTSTAAAADPAGCVYIERAAAKVTVADAITGEKKIDMGGTNITYSIVGWQVINTEPKFYNTRQILPAWNALTSQYKSTASNKYRFISFYQFAPTIGKGDHTLGYRTYFAKDIQYDADATLDYTVAGGKIKGTTTDRGWLTLSDRAFVPENTFDVDRQQRKNTTQVTLKVQFNGGTDFYTISNDAHYYLTATIDNTIAAKVGVLYNFDKFLKDYATYQEEELHKLNTSRFYKVSAVATASVTDKTVAANAAAYTVGYSYTITESDAVDGTYTASTATPVALSSELSTDWTTAKSEAEAALTVSLYKGGLSYYNIRIQHFGQEETPWDAARGVQPGTTIEQIYGATGTRTADYLGRYGVVRDNWYNLSVEAIAKLGTAEPKPVNGDPTPDDEIVEQHYISAHVHILPWVLRTQHVNL